MSYQVLARKWRPRSFSELAGQTHVLKTLVNSLENNRLHHAYLFTGTRGVGKTTIARILARCLNCETGITATPCGECSSCREIDEGRFIDLIEVDAASRTKVEDTRELLENVQYSPTRGRFKVYLIDEVHMLSTNSFNALLKTLEEPPPHVKFLLATTDPQKLPVTVLSRCLQFNLKNLSPEQIVEHLSHILKAEDIAFEEASLWQLGRAAKGSVRDSLTLLDQAIAYCDSNITEKEISDLLGTIDQAVVHQLTEALAARDGSRLLGVVSEAAEHGADFGAVLEELLAYLHRVALAQVVPDGIDNSQGDRAAVLEHAASLPAEAVQLYYQIGLKGREDLHLALDARSGLEMCLLRMLAFTPEGVPNLPDTPLDPEGESPADAEDLKKKPEISAGKPVAEKPQVTSGPIDKSLSVPARTSVANAPDPAIAPAKHQNAHADEGVSAHSGDHAEANRAAPSDQQKVPERQSFTLSALTPKDWIPLYYSLGLGGITGNMAANALLIQIEGNKLTFLLEEAQAALLNDEHRRRMEQALSQCLQSPTRVIMEPGNTDSHEQETPARFRRRKETERLEQAVATFERDVAVQELIERFSGTIVADSIEPLTPKNY